LRRAIATIPIVIEDVADSANKLRGAGKNGASQPDGATSKRTKPDLAHRCARSVQRKPARTEAGTALTRSLTLATIPNRVVEGMREGEDYVSQWDEDDRKAKEIERREATEEYSMEGPLPEDLPDRKNVHLPL
jgi:hypothetical protein